MLSLGLFLADSILLSSQVPHPAEAPVAAPAPADVEVNHTHTFLLLISSTFTGRIIQAPSTLHRCERLWVEHNSTWHLSSEIEFDFELTYLNALQGFSEQQSNTFLPEWKQQLTKVILNDLLKSAVERSHVSFTVKRSDVWAGCKSQYGLRRGQCLQQQQPLNRKQESFFYGIEFRVSVTGTSHLMCNHNTWLCPLCYTIWLLTSAPTVSPPYLFQVFYLLHYFENKSSEATSPVKLVYSKQ